MNNLWFWAFNPECKNYGFISWGLEVFSTSEIDLNLYFKRFKDLSIIIRVPINAIMIQVLLSPLEHLRSRTSRTIIAMPDHPSTIQKYFWQKKFSKSENLKIFEDFETPLRLFVSRNFLKRLSIELKVNSFHSRSEVKKISF